MPEATKPMKILVLGGNGMFGSMVATVLAGNAAYAVEQTMRPGARTHAGVADIPTHRCDVLDADMLMRVLVDVRPDCVVNCTGLIKQRPEADDVLAIYPINAMFPHRLALLCEGIGARLIQFSTDCVFSGKTGNYADDADADMRDNYGLSKWLGEVRDRKHVLTLRTSIIGHEAEGRLQLVDWFLSQQGTTKGFRRAIFSGFPTVEIGRILAEYVLPRPDLHGVYNISADPISKYDLLHIVRDVYEKQIEIVPDDAVKIDRSLDSSVLRGMLGYTPPPWTELVGQLRATRPDFDSKN